MHLLERRNGSVLTVERLYMEKEAKGLHMEPWYDFRNKDKCNQGDREEVVAQGEDSRHNGIYDITSVNKSSL